MKTLTDSFLDLIETFPLLTLAIIVVGGAGASAIAYFTVLS